MFEEHHAKLVAITPNAEKLMAYCARVSSPNQTNENIAGLLSYCLKHGHISVFTMANLVLELTTTRAIAQQFIRHTGFSVQEFSQRYAVVSSDLPISDIRLQDAKNRQASNDVLSSEQKANWQARQAKLNELSYALYTDMLEAGIAKECARNVLPLNTPTRLYANGTIRQWLTYFKTRIGGGTQREHEMLARSAWSIFKAELPIIAEAAQEFVFDKDL